MYFESIATPSVEDAPPGIEHILEYRHRLYKPKVHFCSWRCCIYTPVAVLFIASDVPQDVL
jgi:hypothetical protein